MRYTNTTKVNDDMKTHLKGLSIFILIFMPGLSFSYAVDYGRQGNLNTETYKYLGENVKFTGNMVSLGFGEYSFPVSGISTK